MLPFSQVDVFTATLSAGNPVAVVHQADGLTEKQMAAFARWTNLAETTFLLSPTDPAADYRLRIFTTRRELPFAGHPTLGSARAWLAADGTPRVADRLVQQCEAGLVPVRRDGQRLAFAAPALLRSGPVDKADVDSVARALHLRPEQVLGARWCDNGPGWMGLLLADAETVLAIEPDRAGLGDFNVGVIGPYAASSEVQFEVRAFVPKIGLGEDPVTGSLNAGLARWLIETGAAPASYLVSQGTRLQRQGRVHVRKDEGQIWVGGDTVLGITGTVDLATGPG